MADPLEGGRFVTLGLLPEDDDPDGEMQWVRVPRELLMILGHPAYAAPAVGELPAPKEMNHKPVPAVADPFHGGDFAPVLAHLPLLALNKAIQNSGPKHQSRGWDDQRGNTVPTSTHQYPKGGVYVSLRPTDGNTLVAPGDVLAKLHSVLDQVDDTTSDTLMFCLAMLADVGAGAGQGVTITADAVLDARGIKRRRNEGEPGNWTHGHRKEDLNDIGRAIAQLAGFWLSFDLGIIPEKRDKNGRIIRHAKRVKHESPALMLLGQIVTDAPDEGRVFRTATVALGQWVEAFTSEHIRQVAHLGRLALSYDPYRQIPEKRLAKYLAFMWRINAGDGALIRKVDTLLEEAGIPLDQRNPERTRRRLHDALNRLETDGLQGRWRYLDGRSKATGAGKNEPARGWLKSWSTASIALTPPAAVPMLIAPAGELPAPDETIQ